MDINKIKKLQREIERSQNPPQEVAFDCTKNGNHYNPLYPKYSNRMYLSCHIDDNAMRSILHLCLEDMGLGGNCSDEALCNFLVQNDLWDETTASCFALNYIANKEVE